MTRMILIPVAKLEEGFYESARHIGNLIKASEQLYENRLYSGALPLIVLAIEEIAKLGKIKDHILSNQPITHQEWLEITGPGSHKKKLKMRVERDSRMLKDFTPEKYELIKKYNEDRGITSTLPYDEMKKDAPETLEVMEMLDTFKQDCFYLGWKKDWWTLAIGFTAEEQEAILWILMRQAKKWLLISIIGKRYPNDVNSYESELFSNDPEMKELMILNKDLRSPEHLRRTEIYNDVLRRYPR